jgi:hypothetical protein
MPELLNEVSDRITYRPDNQADRDQEFEAVCKLHPEMRVEMDQFGNIIVMPPGSPDSGFHSLEASTQLAAWTKKDATGRAFDCHYSLELARWFKDVPRRFLGPEDGAA